MHSLMLNLACLIFTLAGACGGWALYWPQQETETSTTSQTRWNNDQLWGQPEPPPPYQAVRVYAGLPLKQPVGMARAPGSNRLFVYERRGRLYSFVDSKAARSGQAVEPDLCLDIREISPETREIYGVAFAPDFEDSGDVYICYISKPNHESGTQVSRFKMTSAEPPTIDLESEEPLLSFRSGGHNGGCLRFGPDGYLYISSGDAGPASPPDPLMTGQDNRDLLSSILRIDVSRRSATLPYSIPSDNPLIGKPNCRPEIYAYGLRNPWKMSFDPRNGDLWVGDVGWELWEMIYRIVPGGNYGWRIREGHQVIHPDDPPGPTPILPPAAVHSHRESRSITGGYVYLGEQQSELYGHYIYADYETGKIWSLNVDDEQIQNLTEIADTDLKIVAFGQNLDNELLLVDFQGGGLYELAPQTDTRYNPNFPTRLSETGLFSNVHEQIPAPGMHEYLLTAQPWMDSMQARRWVGIPSPDAAQPSGQGFRFPEGTVFVKTISVPGQHHEATSTETPERHLETQILLFQQGVWQAYSYVWNPEQTDAELAPSQGTQIDIEIPTQLAAGAVDPLTLMTWKVSSRAECLGCHTTFKPDMGILGFEPPQLQRFDALTGQDSQWARLAKAGILPVNPPSDLKLADPYSETGTIEARARSYLHVNCRHCHRDGGGGGSTMKLEFHRPLDQLDLVDWKAQHGDLGLEGGQRIASGKPENSVLLLRMAKIGRGRMPYKGSDVVDATGLAVLADWISSLDDETQAAGPGSEPLGPWTQKPVDLDPEKLPLNRESEALALTVALHRATQRQDVRQAWSDLASGIENPTIRDLLDGLVPFKASQRTLGQDFDVAALLALPGDSARGRELFFSRYFQCAQCHRVGGEGGSIGPDLSAVATRQTRAQLLNSLSRPAETITEGYQTSIISTIDGGIISARVLESTPDQIRVATSEGKVLEIETAGIETIEASPLSLMPDDLVANMSAEQLCDLLAYLETLKSQ